MIAGAFKSKTIWVNALLATLAALELSGALLTEVLGREAAASVLLVSSLVNVFLRTLTTQPLSEK